MIVRFDFDLDQLTRLRTQFSSADTLIFLVRLLYFFKLSFFFWDTIKSKPSVQIQRIRPVNYRFTEYVGLLKIHLLIQDTLNQK